MAHTKQDRVIHTGNDQTDGVPCSLKGESELENLDRQAGHQYLPMDVYIDPKTMEEHFQASSIRSRRTKIHQTTS
jgi:hypothetical protein